MRYCLNVHGVMLCDGPQHHEGGCTFTQGWQLARKLEDELASIAGYAGDTTNELRETRERVEAAEAALADVRRALQDVARISDEALQDGHPGIPEMARVHRRAVSALDDALAAAGPAHEETT